MAGADQSTNETEPEPSRDKKITYTHTHTHTHTHTFESTSGKAENMRKRRVGPMDDKLSLIHI